MHEDRPTSCGGSCDARLGLHFTSFGLLCSVVPRPLVEALRASAYPGSLAATYRALARTAVAASRLHARPRLVVAFLIRTRLPFAQGHNASDSAAAKFLASPAGSAPVVCSARASVALSLIRMRQCSGVRLPPHPRCRPRCF